MMEEWHNQGTCSRCGEENVDVCSGDHCRDCHVSLSWESCTDGSFDRALMKTIGVDIDKLNGVEK